MPAKNMGNVHSIIRRVLSICAASLIGYLAFLLYVEPERASTPDATFFVITAYCLIATDYFFIKRKKRTTNVPREIIYRCVALIPTGILTAILVSPRAAIGIGCMYILLGIFEEFLLNEKKAPPTQKTNAEKIKNLFIAFGPIWALFILSFVIIYLTGYFDSLLEIQNRPPLAPNGQLTRLQWITHYSMLGIAYYLIRTQQNASNKITVDTITAVHFLHLLLSSIWPFTLSALSSSIFGIGFLSIMGVTVLYLAYMAKQISVQSVYFILPTIIGRMINFYSLTAIIVLNPDQWNFF